MIRYTLQCENTHRFEGWFKGSDAFDKQAASGHLTCPDCGSAKIEKSLMTPGVPRKSGDERVGPRELFNQVRALRSKVMAETEDVGHAFPTQARQMHNGDIEHRPIRGHASAEEAKELVDDGIPVAPIPPEPPAEN